MDEEQPTEREYDEGFTARTLAEEFVRNPENAEERYQNEELVVQGEISEIRNVISAVVLRIQGIGQRYDGAHLEIHLGNRNDADTIGEGDFVRFRGECQGHRTESGPKDEGILWIRFTDAVLE